MAIEHCVECSDARIALEILIGFIGVYAAFAMPRPFTESIGLTDHVWEATKQATAERRAASVLRAWHSDATAVVRDLPLSAAASHRDESVARHRWR